MRDLLRAARIHKIVPLLALMVCAATIRRGSTHWGWLALGAAFVLVVSIAGMKLNVLTDESLDRKRKPQLHRWLTARPGLLRTTLCAETLVAAILLGAAVVLCDLRFVLGLVVYAVAFTLYSYNFLSRTDPVRRRLKIVWWGNFCACCAGYFALWTIGLNTSTAGAPTPAWLCVAAGASLIDYGVFLNECATDAEEERSAGLRTMPALLGERRTADVALAILGTGATICAIVWATTRLDWAPRGPLALAWLAGAQFLGCLLARVRSQWRVGGSGLERIADISFWSARLGMVALLLLPV
jgi:4-hydroxybenzoate polyprenyltransferase